MKGLGQCIGHYRGWTLADSTGRHLNVTKQPDYINIPADMCANRPIQRYHNYQAMLEINAYNLSNLSKTSVCPYLTSMIIEVVVLDLVSIDSA